VIQAFQVSSSDSTNSIRVRRDLDDHAVIIRVEGELDILTAPVLVEELHAAEALLTPPVPVVVDLAGVTFLASAGLSALTEYGQRYAELGSQLRVVATTRAVVGPLTMTGLHEFLPMFHSEQEALREVLD
jgi:anti-sigma B factor antagonist